MIVIIVLLFLVSIICPNANGFTIAKKEKVVEEEVPFHKPADPEQQEDEEEEGTEPIKSFCLSKFGIETAV